jgi:hypothetical protein
LTARTLYSGSGCQTLLAGLFPGKGQQIPDPVARMRLTRTSPARSAD